MRVRPARRWHVCVGDPGQIALQEEGFAFGQEHDGLRQMFHMMNEARAGVGMAAAAQGYTAYLQALSYARTRQQGKPLSRGRESVEEAPVIAHPDVRRMLLAQKSYVEGALALGLYCSRLVDETITASTDAERDDAELLLEVLTLIAKSWPSQWSRPTVWPSRYTVDTATPATATSNSSTGTIGSIPFTRAHTEFMASIFSVARCSWAAAAACTCCSTEAERTVSQASALGHPLADWADALASAARRVERTTALLWKDGEPAGALANATIYLEAVGHVVVARIWLQQALAAHGKTGDFYDGKRLATRYFFHHELPKTTAQFDLLDSGDRTTIDLDENWF
jgi:hypothetical protein